MFKFTWSDYESANIIPHSMFQLVTRCLSFASKERKAPSYKLILVLTAVDEFVSTQYRIRT